MSNPQLFPAQGCISRAGRAISWCEILSELLAGTLRAKGRGFHAGFPVYMEREVFFSSRKQVINSLQSQEGKSKAVCFHCTKSKLHFLPHPCHSPAMSEKRLDIDFSKRSMKSQNWKPVPSCRALQFPKWRREEKQRLRLQATLKRGSKQALREPSSILFVTEALSSLAK